MAVCYFASTLGLKRQWSEGEDSDDEEEEKWSCGGSGRYGGGWGVLHVSGAWQHAWIVLGVLL